MLVEISQIDLLKKQDRYAQKEVYHITLPYFRAIVRRYLRDNTYTKDVLQEGYLKVFSSVKNFDSSQATFRTWAAKIFINFCLNYNDRVVLGKYEELSEDKGIPEIEIKQDINHLTQFTLIKLLKKMPIDYYDVFNMYIVEGYSHQEIGEYLGITESLSRKRLSRGRTWLKKRFKNDDLDVKVFKTN